MTLLSTYNFEGQTDGANAAASSPWEIGTGTTPIVVENDAAVHGSVGGRISAAASYRAIAWVEAQTSAARVIDVYIVLKAISANASIIACHDGATQRGDVRITSSRTVQLRNGTSAVATSSEVLSLDTVYRFSWWFSSTGQELRVYEGESSTPLFTLTGAVTNALHTSLRAGLAAASSGFSLDFDTIRIADDWLAPVNPSLPLATPGSFTFVPDATAPEIVATWADVTGEDHYELQVQKHVASVWTEHDVYEVVGTTRTLDDSDGIEAGTAYRGRVRAMPGA